MLRQPIRSKWAKLLEKFTAFDLSLTHNLAHSQSHSLTFSLTTHIMADAITGVYFFQDDEIPDFNNFSRSFVSMFRLVWDFGIIVTDAEKTLPCSSTLNEFSSSPHSISDK